eukprot:COSAG01_NODE_3932_length_5522_cov_153.687258_3_plen_157_part_00
MADILKQERTEKELRVAEMEANKASNLLAHRQAIAGRPARSWFQTEVQKRTVKNNWRDQREALDIGVREEGARTRKKKTRGEAKAAKRSEEKVCTAAPPPPPTHHTHRPGRFGAPGAGVCLLSAYFLCGGVVTDGDGGLMRWVGQAVRRASRTGAA